MSPGKPRHSFLPLRDLLRAGGAGRPFDLRVTATGEPRPGGAYVLYWMQSARRIDQNLALDYAISLANGLRLPVLVYESLRPDYPSANDRIHTFVLQSVAEKYAAAAARGVRYAFFLPHTPKQARGMVARLAAEASVVVTDEFPAFVLREQTRRFIARGAGPVHLVDSNGILPMRAIPGEQYSARFLRDRAHRLFESLWSRPPELAPKRRPFRGDLPFEPWDGVDVAAAVKACRIDHGVGPVETAGGREEALRRLGEFVDGRLDGYAAGRSRAAAGTSGLSPYLHFGMVSAEEVARAVLLSGAPGEDVDDFLEECVIRRELSFNFCFYREDHDSLSSLPEWARKTLDRHRKDRRKPLYSPEELERGETYDEVWNLSQRGLLETGTMHNYLRMLWGKKIIEWSATPEEAHATMLLLHERYALDGRDPNTHAGVLWCFGKHDRAWAPERPVFGTLRYMSSDSTRRKVDLAGYAEWVDGQ